MKVFKVKDIQYHQEGLSRLVGFSIDKPAVNQCFDWPLIEIGGWVVGKDRPITEVEFTLQVLNLPLQVAPINLQREDVERFLPQVKNSKNSGFYNYFSAIGLPPEFKILVNAIDCDREVIPIAGITIESKGDLKIKTDDLSFFQPILVSALPRSGTTWLIQLLIAHPAIIGYPHYPYELRAAGYWWHACRVLTMPSGLTGLSHPDLFWFDLQRISRNPSFSIFHSDIIDWFKDKYINRVLLHYKLVIDKFYKYLAKTYNKSNAIFFIEKQSVPYYSWLAWELYSKTREIFLVRDWRDVFCSILAFNSKRGTMRFGRELVDNDIAFAHRLIQGISNIHQQFVMRSNRVLLVRYEDLVLNTSNELKRILDYIGVDSDSSTIKMVMEQTHLLDPLLEQRRIGRSAHESIGRWKHDLSPEFQEKINFVFKDYLQLFGYS